MDSVASCKDKLAYFRIKELKDVLNKLGLAKQGKKQDLVDRILAAISDGQGSKVHGWVKKNSIGKEEIARIIDDTYRKMQTPGATDLASKVQNGSNSSGAKLKEEVDESYQLDMKIRCICGSSVMTESMIKCEDSRCNSWQHVTCVIIPEKPLDGVQPEIPAQFYCELCRLNRADPFWVTLGHPLYPVKLVQSSVTEGGNPIQTVERTFTLTRADKDLLQKAEYDIQAWCMLLNDKIPFRMQWPQYADLQVNAVPIRTTNRPGTQLLGINGRDDGPAITTCSKEGINKIFLSGCDARIFCLGVRIVKRKTVQQVLNMIPKEGIGERFEDALARVCRCIGGGNTADNADSDSDLEVVAESVSVNIRCPMSGSRMKVAGRFKPCVHMGCFDLDTFVEMNQRSRKWQCPICLKNYSLEHVIIDPYFNRITSLMRDCGEDVTEIEVKPDGSWRVKNETECRNLVQWHNPDGSLCVSAVNVKMKLNQQSMKQVKQEAGSDGHMPLKLGIKRNQNGIWEVSKPEDMRTLSSGENFENNGLKVMVANSSATTGSYRDGEDTSVNQEGGGHFDFSVNNGHELDSMPLNFDAAYNSANRVLSAPSADPDVIVLSDSDEDNIQLISPETAYETGHSEANGISFPIHPHGASDPYADPSLACNENPCLGLFSNNTDDFGMPLWPMPPCPQNAPGFQFFSTDTDVHDPLIDVEHNSNQEMNDYGLVNPDLASASHATDSQACRSNNDIMVDNPLAFGGDDPSLQIFLPSQPAGTAIGPDLRDQNDISNAGRTEDWISLRLGGGDHVECAAPANGLNFRNQFVSKEERMDSLVDTASLLLSMNEGRSDKSSSNRQNFGGPFSHPRQKRSVRPRLYLSIDTDSDE